MSSFHLGGGGTSWSHCFPVPSALSHSLTSSPFTKRNCGHCDTNDLTTPLRGRVSSGSGDESDDCFFSTTYRKSGSACCSAAIVTRFQSSGRVVLAAGDAAVWRIASTRCGRLDKASALTCLDPGRCCISKSNSSTTDNHLACCPMGVGVRRSHYGAEWSVLRRKFLPSKY